MRCSALAEQSGSKVVTGLMGESALGTLAGLQFSATITDPIVPAELTWYLAMTQQPILAMPTIANGALTLPETPSTGRFGGLQCTRPRVELSLYGAS